MRSHPWLRWWTTSAGRRRRQAPRRKVGGKTFRADRVGPPRSGVRADIMLTGGTGLPEMGVGMVFPRGRGHVGTIDTQTRR